MSRFYGPADANALLPELMLIVARLRDQRAELVELRDAYRARQAALAEGAAGAPGTAGTGSPGGPGKPGGAGAPGEDPAVAGPGGAGPGDPGPGGHRPTGSDPAGGHAPEADPIGSNGAATDPELRRLHLRMRGIVDQMQADVAWLDERGIVLREIATGLLDFPALAAGRPVWLCWRLGETEVAHWHGPDEGFAGRRPLLTLPDEPGRA